MQNLKKKKEYQRKDRTHEKKKGANKLCQAENPIQNFINEDKLKAKGVSVDGSALVAEWLYQTYGCPVILYWCPLW